MENMREKFESSIKKRSKNFNSFLLSPDKYEKLINQVVTIKTSGKKKSSDYWLLQHYDVLEHSGRKNLIFPRKNSNENILYYISSDKLFQTLYETHIAIGHGGRDRMYKELSKTCKNVTITDIKKFLDVCVECHQKKGKDKRTPPVVKPILSNELNSRCQVDLIDFQSRPDGKYKFILVYQDNLTKYTLLRPLMSKQAIEVAKKIFLIFTDFGAPEILHSDNGKEFRNTVVQSLKKLWPQLKLIHGKPRHSESQGSVERANRDVENMIFTWMQDNCSERWSEGLPLVQFMKNRAYHAGIQRSPYKALFGCDAKFGLGSSQLPKEIINSLETEEDLIKCIEEINENYEKMNLNENEDNIEVSPSNELINENITSVSSSPIDRHLDEINNINVSTTNSPTSENENNLENLMEKCEFEFECTKCKRPTVAPPSSSYMFLFSKRKRRDDNVESADILCSLCLNEKRIDDERTNARAKLQKQAEKMMTRSVQYFSQVEIGATIRLPIPEEDRGRCEAKSILAVVLNKENNMYKLGTKYGILEQRYIRSQFTVCAEKLIDIDEVPDKEISLRTSAIEQSSSTGGGFLKCNCQRKCTTKQCTCLRKKVLCNSKCHNSKTCKNK